MNRMWLAIGVLSMACGGLASAAQEEAPQQAQPAVAAEQAAPARTRAPKLHTRMRIIDDAHADVRFYRNQACYSGEAVIASKAGAMPDIFKRKKVVSIGIPVTPALEAMKERSGFMTNAFYREFALAPGEPVVIRAGYVSGPVALNRICAFPAITFVPEKGTDYEVETRVTDQRCILTLGKIVMTEGKAEVVPAPWTETAECPKAN